MQNFHRRIRCYRTVISCMQVFAFRVVYPITDVIGETQTFVIGSNFCFVQPNRREEMAMTAIVKASNFQYLGFFMGIFSFRSN